MPAAGGELAKGSYGTTMWGLLSLLAMRDRVVDPALLVLGLLELLAPSIRELTTKLSKDAFSGRARNTGNVSRPPWLRRLELSSNAINDMKSSALVGTVRFGPAVARFRRGADAPRSSGLLSAYLGPPAAVLWGDGEERKCARCGVVCSKARHHIPGSSSMAICGDGPGCSNF